MLLLYLLLYKHQQYKLLCVKYKMETIKVPIYVFIIALMK